MTIMAITTRFFSIKHNRWLGVHNPFGSNKGKAEDPYINRWTLGRLLKDYSTRQIAMANALARKKIPKNLARVVLAADFSLHDKTKIADKLVKQEYGGDFRKAAEDALIANTVLVGMFGSSEKQALIGGVVARVREMYFGPAGDVRVTPEEARRLDMMVHPFFSMLAERPPGIVKAAHELWVNCVGERELEGQGRPSLYNHKVDERLKIQCKVEAAPYYNYVPIAYVVNGLKFYW
jgi:hypothetical protein